jgi:hypothetical protein
MPKTDSALVADSVPSLTPRSSPELDSDCASAAEIQSQLPIVHSSSLRNSCWRLLPCLVEETIFARVAPVPQLAQRIIYPTRMLCGGAALLNSRDLVTWNSLLPEKLGRPEVRQYLIKL